MNTFKVVLAAFSLSVLAADAAEKPLRQAQDRPNIVIVMVDDMGFSDCGFNGGKVIQTPNIDTLARQGTTFGNFYVQSVCSTSRATLLTGRLPSRHGIYGALKTDSGFGLPLEERTMAQGLRSAGYTTAICGKWHLGEFEPAYRPMQRGFDHQYGLWYGQIDYYTHERGGRVDWYRDGKPLDEEGYATQLIGQEAERLIREQPEDTPLFLFVAFNGVHGPFQAPENYMDRYANQGLTKERQTMAAMLSSVDDAVGQVVSALEEKGQLDNTLIIFSSDNGGVMPGKYTSNEPLRAGKATLYEGGIRSAAFAVWPGKISAGESVSDPVHIVDLYPSMLKLAGADLDQPLPVDGIDIMPLLTNGTPLDRDAILTVGGNGGKKCAIRIGDWKLMRMASGKLELYNLANDLGETRNLVASEPERAERMLARLEAMMVGAVPPLKKVPAPGKGASARKRGKRPNKR